MNQLHHHYESVFAPYIEGLILQKKADGFIYELEAVPSHNSLKSSF